MKKINKVIFMFLFMLTIADFNYGDKHKCICGHFCTDDCLVVEENVCNFHDCNYSAAVLLEDKGPIG